MTTWLDDVGKQVRDVLDTFWKEMGTGGLLPLLRPVPPSTATTSTHGTAHACGNRTWSPKRRCLAQRHLASKTGFVVAALSISP